MNKSNLPRAEDPDKVLFNKNNLGPRSLRECEFTDLYFSPDGEVMFKGFNQGVNALNDLSPGVLDDLHSLFARIQTEAQTRSEFFVDFDLVRYRIAPLPDINSGTWYTARRPKLSVPRLRSLGIFTLPHINAVQKCAKNGGLILIAGATGNGKTTTAYSLLQEFLLGYGDIGITVEDPVEMRLTGKVGTRGHCFQTQLSPGQTYRDALKTILRNNPKYILIGELRSPEDAQVALRAAMSGHLVITTIHAGTIEEALESIVVLAG